MTRNLTLAALAVALAATTAHAQQPAANQTTNQGAVNDNLFAQAAAIGGLAEVQISELGAQKATDPELKKFSQQMIQEHTRMNSELMTVAGQKQLSLPRTVDPRAAFCAQSLAGLSGEEFDRCYAKAQLVAHMDSLATFEAEAERGQDPQLKALAAKGVPHIREHLQMIRPIALKYMRDRERSGGGESKKADDASTR